MGDQLELIPRAIHECHAKGCLVRVAPRLLMCHRHWYMVPRATRIAILNTYRRGQERDKRPSLAWRRAARRAIDLVSAHEGWPP